MPFKGLYLKYSNPVVFKESEEEKTERLASIPKLCANCEEEDKVTSPPAYRFYLKDSPLQLLDFTPPLCQELPPPPPAP